MKKLTWIAVISIMMGIIIISCKTKFATTKATYKATASTPAFEHGKDLAFTICAGCHYDHTVNKFIGTPIHDVPAIAGKVFSANLTNSKTHGIPPHYTDAELKYLLKTGVAKDGRFLSYMLRPNMSDEDINDIIVFLRSNDPAIAAADTTIGLTHYNFIGKAYMNMNAKPAPYHPGVKRPSADNPIALGGYLVDNIGCFHCHSKSFSSLDLQIPEQSKGYLAGGIKFKEENGKTIYASNITPDKTTGIGDYSKLEFRKALKDGQALNKKLRPPMPKFDRLTDTEIDAIYAYLQSIPAKYHQINL
jgi:mono/diheme cytochrome c family protein